MVPSVCSLCRPGITGSVPQVPSNLGRSFLDREQGLAYYLLLKKQDPALINNVGIPHHDSLEALAESAKSCQLCGLIQQQAEGYIASFKEKESDPFFQYHFMKEMHHALPKSTALRIAKCHDERDGFFVLMYAEKCSILYLLAVISFCADEDSPWSETFAGRPIAADGGTKLVLDRAANWLKGCVENHDCGKTADVKLPTRLLDLSLADSKKILLCEFREEQGRYAALSHCWGDNGHFTTSKSTMDTRKQGIEIDQLPRTFQDAILMTRHLGIRYLWIDSLCICQDDADDWARESAVMRELYENAYLTLAADSALDGTYSMLQREPRHYVSVTSEEIDGKCDGSFYAFVVPRKDALVWSDCIWMSDEPLSKRAWALQERVLPRRVLHYTSKQMAFECMKEFRGEDGFCVQGRVSAVFGDKDTPLGKMNRGSSHSPSYGSWYSMVEEFGLRSLCRSTDKLPALSGLARLVESRTGAQYVAGLWSDALVEGLAWQGLSAEEEGFRKRLTQYIAPSWSWAAYDGVSATGSGLFDWVDVATIAGYHVEPKTSNPYGEVSDGWIEINAPMLPLTLSDLPEKDEAELPASRNMRLCVPDGRPFGWYSGFDYQERQSEASRAWVREKDLSALLLRKVPDDNHLYHAMIVEPSDRKPVGPGHPRMRRLGYIMINVPDSVEAPENRRDIVLV